MKPISLIFPYSTTQRKNKKNKPKKRMVKFHNDYTEFEIQNMDDPQLERLYEHGTPAEREIARKIIKMRDDWDTIINKSIDDPLPAGSGQPGAPTAGGN